MPSRRLATVLAACCFALITVGCGASGSSPTASATGASPTQTPLSAAAYRSALHKVAQQEDAAQNKVEQAFHARTVPQVRAALTIFATDQRQAAAQLAALTAPAEADRSAKRSMPRWASSRSSAARREAEAWSATPVLSEGNRPECPYGYCALQVPGGLLAK